ncbi:MAG: hypothetical protein RLZZ209_607 [Bacteroidota bacterium]|jgi:hypothetical protein
MNKELEEHLRVLRGLGQWETTTDFSENLLTQMTEKTAVRWMAAASILAFLFSGFVLMASAKTNKEMVASQQKEVSKAYEVNNLNY